MCPLITHTLNNGYITGLFCYLLILEPKQLIIIINCIYKIPQVKEFKYLWVLFSSEGTMEREMGRRIGAAGWCGQGKESLGLSAGTATPATRPWISGRRWMDGWLVLNIYHCVYSPFKHLLKVEQTPHSSVKTVKCWLYLIISVKTNIHTVFLFWL